MDITEINPRRAGRNFASGQDRTYRIAANLIKRIAFNLNPTSRKNLPQRH
jgi:hypothetical protein